MFKNGHAPELVEQTVIQNSAIQSKQTVHQLTRLCQHHWMVIFFSNCFKQLLKKIIISDVSTILLTDKNIFTVIKLKNLKNHQLYAAAATKKDVATKRLHTRSAFGQSLMASVSESQEVEKTQV